MDEGDLLPTQRALHMKLFSPQERGKVRRDGFATTQSGWHQNINSVAAVVFGVDRIPIAAVGISGPSERMPTKRLKELSADVMHAAMEIAETLHGHSTY